MSGKITIRLAVLGALAALVAVLVPAGFASGAHETGLIGPAGFVYVDLDRRGGEAQFDTLTQPLSTRNNDCTVVNWATSPDIVSTVASGTGPETGLVATGFKDGQIGGKGSSDGSGEPCARLDSPYERLTVSLGSAVPFLADAIDFDIELKFGGTGDFKFSNSQETGPAAGPIVVHFDPQTDKNDDGPDSGDGDNYRAAMAPKWDHDGDSDPNDLVPFHFDTVEIVALTGTVAFEGGHDGTDNACDGSAGCGGITMDSSNNFSQFRLIQEFDGDIDCQETVTFGGTGGNALAEITLHSTNAGSGANPWTVDGTVCPEKLWIGQTTASSVIFIPSITSSIVAHYTGELTAYDQPVTSDGSGQITSLTFVYNDSGDRTDPTRPLLPCLDQPILVNDSANTDYEDFWQRADVQLLPAGETSCYFEVSVEVTGTNSSGQPIGTEKVHVYFPGDPFYGF